jgi:anhydro-N-acetylmuramic acid kinase
VRLIGLMSGTSFDAVDAVAVDVTAAAATGTGGSGELRVGIRGHLTVDIPADLQSRLAAALPPNPASAADLCLLDTRMGQAFAAAASAALSGLCDGTADAVVCSGQTIYHWVDGRDCLGTLQIGEPTWIAEATGLPVISNLRSRDVAAGGQGAPLVSLVDAMLLGDRPGVAAVNIGGIANITVPALRLAYDIGPGNALIDAAVAAGSGGDQRMDRNGERADRGRVDPDLLSALRAEPYYAAAPPKTTGKELFHAGYLDRFERPAAIDDLIATLTRLTAVTIADAVRRHQVSELVVSGGGLRNPTLMAMLRAELDGVAIRPIDDLGVPNAAKEAVAFAILGFLSWHGLAGVDPAYTGAKRATVLGSITPGRGPLRLPPPMSATPQRLVLS